MIFLLNIFDLVYNSLHPMILISKQSLKNICWIKINLHEVKQLMQFFHDKYFIHIYSLQHYVEILLFFIYTLGVIHIKWITWQFNLVSIYLYKQSYSAH